MVREWAAWAGLREAGESLPLPTVTLHLRGGRDFHGIVCALSESSAGDYLVLDPTSDRGPSTDHVHIPCLEIQAITNHGFGPGEPVETAPSLLQYRRNLAEWEAELKSSFGVTITVESNGDPVNLAALDALRARMAQITLQLAQDREASKSFARAVQKIELAVAEPPSLTLTRGTLRAETCISILERMRAQQLRATLESLL